MKRIKIILAGFAIVTAVGAAFAFRAQHSSADCVLYEMNPSHGFACDIPVYNLTTTTGIGTLTEGYARTPGNCEQLIITSCGQ